MRLSSEQFAALSPLLDEGLGLSEGARTAWLDGMKEPFPGAKSLLRQMLAKDASGAAEGLLQTLPKLSSAPGSVQPNPEAAAFHPDMRIGHYRLVREIGHGGMSTVWLAMRMDELVTRPVALKLPHLHLQSAMFADRFARERDILANLTHPNIAHLYDAGISPQGQPYLVMEFVDGESLTLYCQARWATVRERLELFLQVLSAVHHAHAQNIIHRDLKPSNILVREGAQVVLLDFGIAKLLIEGEADATELTRHGGAAFTPDYASPEQIKGETLSPATDIYSLGVVLYELLTNQRPYELKRSTRRELEEAILSTDPRRPSDKVTKGTQSAAPHGHPEIQRKELRGDLDSIVLKAIKKPPKDRYPSAEAFAEDLRRHLRHDAVSAQPDTLWYRTTRLAQRHREILATVTLAVTLSAVVGVLAVNRGFISMNRPAADVPVALANTKPAVLPAIAIPEKSVAVLPFVDMSKKKDQEYFSDGLSEELIDVLSKIPDLRVPARTSSFYFKGKQTTIADIARELNVANVLEGSIRQSGNALRITAQLIKVSDGSHLWSETYDRKMGDIFAIQDEIADAVVKALKASLLAGGTTPRIGVGRNVEAYTLFLQGRSIYQRAYDERTTETAISYLRQAVSADPMFAEAWAHLSFALNYGATNWSPGKFEVRSAEARRAADRAMALDPLLGDAHRAAAYIYLDDWNSASAAAEFKKGYELDPGNPGAARTLADMIFNLRMDDMEALRLYKKAIDLDPLYAWSYLTLSLAEFDVGEYREAEATVHKAIDLNVSSQAFNLLAMILIESGRPAEALPGCARIDRELDREECLALVYSALGRKPDADASLVRVERLGAMNAPYAIARIHAYRDEADQAFTWLNRAYMQHQSSENFVNRDPLLRNLWSDARYKAFLRKMNLPD
jgi:eukaryotic-like serine/threonine-protein kinase